MNAKLAVISLSFSLAASGAFAAGNQPVQTDYQRIMNSVNSSSAAAFGQPQADDDADNSTSQGTPAATDTNNVPQANTTQDQSDSANLPTNGIANSYSANGAPGGVGTVGTNNRFGNNAFGATTTTTGSPGLGAFNASPYNNSPNSNGRVGFTGQ